MSIDLENGDTPPEDPKKPRGRPPKAAQVGDLERDMREQLEELAEWIKVRDPELAQTFLVDVGKMAKFLATKAGKHESLARLLRVLFAKDGPLAGLRAFGRTARMIVARINSRRADDEEDAAMGVWVDEHGNQRDAAGNIIVPHA